MKIRVEEQQIPFWLVESRYLTAKQDLAWELEGAETLEDAIRTGVNMVWLDDEQTGWLNEDGTITLQGNFTEQDLKTAVRFDYKDTDADGYTIAYFERSKE